MEFVGNFMIYLSNGGTSVDGVDLALKSTKSNISYNRGAVGIKYQKQLTDANMTINEISLVNNNETV
jgi:hypothetical protein